MLKKRIIPTLLFKNFGLVKGIGFDSWRRVGTVMQTVKVYNMREVDELIFVDITATKENRPPDFATIDEIADECFMPLCVGGGIKNVDEARGLLKVGADKISLCSSLINNPGLVSEIANNFGSQCVVASIDYKKVNSNKYEVCINSGSKQTGVDPIELAKKVESCGAGEILLTSIDRDGTMTGYDIDMILAVSKAVQIPLIASGGAGDYKDMVDAFIKGMASAVAVASIFHFTERTPLEAKMYLNQKGVDVRL